MREGRKVDAVEGSSEGSDDGFVRGRAADDCCEGEKEAKSDGSSEGFSEGSSEGSPLGVAEGAEGLFVGICVGALDCRGCRVFLTDGRLVAGLFDGRLLVGLLDGILLAGLGVCSNGLADGHAVGTPVGMPIDGMRLGTPVGYEVEGFRVRFGDGWYVGRASLAASTDNNKINTIPIKYHNHEHSSMYRILVDVYNTQVAGNQH